MTNRRWILHVDMDAFFVSVERVLNPDLCGKPVIVGGDPKGRGVVSSASYEARAYGVRSAMPMSQAVRLCPKGIIVSGSHGKYSEFSRNVRAIFERFAPVVEMASLDEAYLDLTGTERLLGHAVTVGERIHNTIKNELNLPSSCGLGGSKLIGKIGSDVAKPNGFLWVMHGHEGDFLSPLPVNKLPGVGEKSFENLSRLGIKTVKDLKDFGSYRLETIFGENGGSLFKRACGVDETPVKPSREAKSVGREHTFETDTCSRDIINATLCYLSEKVGWGLRDIDEKAKTITLKLRYSDFQTVTRAKTLFTPTDSDKAILNAALELFEKAFKRRVRVRLLGVSASNFANETQFDLFEKEDMLKNQRLYDAIDSIKNKHGFLSIHRANSLIYLAKEH